jgi:ferredoxin
MDGLTFYHGFVIPFLVGTGVLFAVIIYKYVRWFVRLPRRDLRLVRKNIFSVATLRGVWECFTECLLHRRIWRVNPLLGYMHTSFALGWFLLILVGWIETVAYLGFRYVPLQGHIFFKFFTTALDHSPRWGVNFGAVMDLLLLYVLSGLALALFKRIRSRALGMRRTTRLGAGDKVALTALWFIFPMRLLAESLTSGIHGSGWLLTGGLGNALAAITPAQAMPGLELAAWWCYSVALGVFFVAMPFSRYMHIFTEIPLIFLRRWGIRSEVDEEKSFDHFQLEACSRCGICIDPCQLQREAGFTGVQSVYFIRDRRYRHLTREVADNCLMCGRCKERCPVGLELDTLRLNSRHTLSGAPSDGRFDYARGLDTSSYRNGGGEPTEASSAGGATRGTMGRVGYFAGCMTLLSPGMLRAMERIFTASGEEVWWADCDGGICCGRPLKLSGDIDAARDMMRLNEELFRKHGITTLVTSCPICLRVFREDYDLGAGSGLAADSGVARGGIEVLHHSE